MIRIARERARLSLEELATQTKLARATLDALERDDFAALTEPVYVRGYYRKCAKVLVLPEADLLGAYEKLVVPKAPQAPTKLLIGGSPSMGRPSSRRRGSGNGGLVAAVVIGAGLLGAVAWVLLNDPGLVSGLRGAPAESATTPGAVTSTVPAGQLSTPPVSGETPPLPEVSAATTPAPAPAPAESTPATHEATQLPPAPAPTTPATVSPPASSPATTSTPVLAPPATAVPAGSSGALSLHFSSTSWIRVEDADGKLLLSGVIQSGDSQQVRGKPPYSLFVGNAPGVKVEYEGKLIDTTPFVKSNSTARLTLPLSAAPPPTTP